MAPVVELWMVGGYVRDVGVNGIIHELECPHPDCQGILKMHDGVPAGEYDCKCKSCKVRLSWAYYQGHGYKPYLTLVEKKG